MTVQDPLLQIVELARAAALQLNGSPRPPGPPISESAIDGSIQSFKVIYQQLGSIQLVALEPKAYANCPATSYKMEVIDQDVCLDLQILVKGGRSEFQFEYPAKRSCFEEQIYNNFPPVCSDLWAHIKKNCGFEPSLWAAALPVFEPILKRLQNEFDVLKVSQIEKAKGLIDKKRKSVQASRIRAKRPEVVQKRNDGSKARALAVLGKVLIRNPKLIDLGSEKLKELINLFLTHWYQLDDLSTWARTRPKGAGVMTVEDLEEALKLAQIAQVISS